jgi:hypothetical protein
MFGRLVRRHQYYYMSQQDFMANLFARLERRCREGVKVP